MISRFLLWIFYRIARKGLKQYVDTTGLKSGRVLDVGCGYGYYSELFSKDYTYVGIDNDARAIKLAGKNYPEGNFKIMDAAELNFPDQNFDLVISIAALHHLTDDQLGKALRGIARVIKDDGRILLVDIVLPERFKLFAYPFFWLDGAQQRTFYQLSGFIEGAGLKILFKQNSRLFNIETCVVSATKIQ